MKIVHWNENRKSIGDPNKSMNFNFLKNDCPCRNFRLQIKSLETFEEFQNIFCL